MTIIIFQDSVGSNIYIGVKRCVVHERRGKWDNNRSVDAARSVIKRGLERATGLSGDASLSKEQGGLFPYSFQVLACPVISGG